jgi:hypothetical protein
MQLTVEGDDSQTAQTDIAIAGLGWVSCGLKGRAHLRIWTPEGIAVTCRRALLPQYAKDFERPGWSQNSKSLFKRHPLTPPEPKEPFKRKKKRRGPKTSKKLTPERANW